MVERWKPGDERPEIVDEKPEWALSTGAGGSIDSPNLFKRIEQ